MIAAQLLAYYFTELKDDQLKRVSSPRRARRWLRQQASDAGRAAEREQAGRLAAGRRMRRMQEGTVAHSPERPPHHHRVFRTPVCFQSSSSRSSRLPDYFFISANGDINSLGTRSKLKPDLIRSDHAGGVK
ncbi:hypothetical protein FQA47_018291 [Oryzias melastigma]|uniref:Uncharacterized protein n=1 Tax=Oryzias melastigma TaxID=30732 RepID=A0A834FT10_ORYME|nr:hypothetical protein FQA47_018291 [Oryzias melastigma]